MKVEWKGPVSGVHWCEAGLLLLSVTEQRNGWLIIVDNADTGSAHAFEDGFVGTLDEAKTRAIQTGMECVGPFVDAARAEEREACVRELEALADQVRTQLDATSTIALVDRGELLAQRAMLSKAVSVVRARSKGGA